MNVSAIKATGSQQHPSFGHAIRVSISLKRPDAPIYDFVNPAENFTLYKKLNSKIIGWLNNDLITSIRKKLGKKRKITQKQSPKEAQLQQQFISDMTRIDSDYRNLKMARSVYRRYHLGFIATGRDVPLIESMVSASGLGAEKSKSEGIRTQLVNQISKKFHDDAVKYIQYPLNRLTEGGKEVMLYLNFIISGTKKSGQPIYELESYEFRRIAKPLPKSTDVTLDNLIYLKQNNVFQEEIADSIRRIKNRILGIK